MEIYPSLISSDLLNLEKTIKMLSPHCEGYHIDVMDNHFVPNLTWGPVFVNSIIKASQKPLDIHFMVSDPKSFIDRINFRDKDTFIFHYEAIDDLEGIIKLVKVKNIKVGIAINPETDINLVLSILDKIDLLLIMSVKPGFSGQPFIPEVINKIKPVVNFRKVNKFSFTIAMDGGVNKSNIDNLKSLGVDRFAMAAAIFSKNDPVKALENIKRK